MSLRIRSRLETLKFIFKNRRHFRDFITAMERDRNMIWRHPGQWHAADIQRYTGMVSQVQGDFAEIGCFEGETLAKMIPIARAQGKMTHAFDSFVGMDDPGDFDCRPKGEFSVGGPEGFRRLMENRGFGKDQYQVWDGYIPACFDKAPTNISFSFVLLDVDNYQPTKQGLQWAWARLKSNGVMALDDYYPGHNVEASKAIMEFMRQRDDFEIVEFLNHQLILQKIER